MVRSWNKQENRKMHGDHATRYTPFEWMLPVLTASLVFGIYLRCVMMFSSTGHCWPKWRTLSFLTGIALLALASSPPLVAAAHADINAHMTQHLLVGMFAPIFLRSEERRVGKECTSVLASVSLEQDALRLH